MDEKNEIRSNIQEVVTEHNLTPNETINVLSLMINQYENESGSREH